MHTYVSTRCCQIPLCSTHSIHSSHSYKSRMCVPGMHAAEEEGPEISHWCEKLGGVMREPRGLSKVMLCHSCFQEKCEVLLENLKLHQMESRKVPGPGNPGLPRALSPPACSGDISQGSLCPPSPRGMETLCFLHPIASLLSMVSCSTIKVYTLLIAPGFPLTENRSIQCNHKGSGSVYVNGKPRIL